ncbi:DnaA regulatory inactivator Hda [Burkholderiaceae bacterium FT117]|uniref:DnaA regulatory inactivator Hda n=1 Tax=Zeimonas sediminis TaxID=2944268 RepID=UPI002342DF09|nr:DnaA regulatory inactivator Hda [Zeimonas sediminis]MCM5570554.1 DnaA regulatory inactivator Hda [Zeimonas sediminis]
MNRSDPGPMRQIPLELSAAEPASFDNYVAGGNAEALAALRALAEPVPASTAAPATGRAIYLWGEPGVGKTHLLDALAAAAGERAACLGPSSEAEAFAEVLARLGTDTAAPQAPVVIVDDCDRLDDARQQEVFHLFNRVRALPGAAFVATGTQPPLALALRDELRTRLGWGVVLRLVLLTDVDKADALRRAAQGRGIALPDELIRWLLTHRSRDIRWLLRLLDALDRYALERKRAITLPLLREFENAERLVKSH